MNWNRRLTDKQKARRERLDKERQDFWFGTMEMETKPADKADNDNNNSTDEHEEKARSESTLGGFLSAVSSWLRRKWDALLLLKY